MSADVLFDKTGEKVNGRIVKVVPSIDPASRTFLIEIALPDRSLRTGLYGKVLIPQGEGIPPRAILALSLIEAS